MPTYEIKKYKCPHCGKMYEDSVRSNFPGKPCKECRELMIKLSQIERRLIAEEFSLEQEDEKIARQINAQLIKESGFILSKPEHDVTSALLKKMIVDEKRRKKILKQLLRIQSKKL
jgi:transposase-like protein